MAKQTINIGSIANDGTGDTIRAGGDKINDNFTELYDADGVLTTAVSGKQATLVSGTNIKTINSTSLLGSGDIVISGGATNLGYTAGISNGVVTSDTGTDATIPLTDATNAGLFSAAQKTKLDGIEASADVTDAANVGAVNAAATSKATPVNADSFPIVDSESTNVIKRLTFTNLKAFLVTYFNTIYQAILVSGTNIKTINGASILGSGDLTVAGSGSGANLAYTASPTNGTVTSDTGTDATLTLADGTNAGLMAPAQHTKLAGIATGATVYTDEMAQDAVGGILDTEYLEYVDSAPSISLSAGSIASLQLADSALQSAAIGTSVQAYSAVLAATTASFLTADETKLDGIEAGAQVNTVTPSNTATLTNKRITMRVQSVTSAATVTPNADNDDCVKVTAQAVALDLANPTGTPTNMQPITIRIKDNGTARAITYGTQYRGIGVTLPTTTVISKTIYLGMMWNSDDTKWDVIGYALQA